LHAKDREALDRRRLVVHGDDAGAADDLPLALLLQGGQAGAERLRAVDRAEGQVERRAVVRAEARAEVPGNREVRQERHRVRRRARAGPGCRRPDAETGAAETDGPGEVEAGRVAVRRPGLERVAPLDAEAAREVLGRLDDVRLDQDLRALRIELADELLRVADPLVDVADDDRV